VSPFEALMVAELEALVRAGVPSRGVRLTVRELVVTRFERGPLGPGEVRDAVGATLRAAWRLVRDAGAPDDVVETACGAALEAVRGHGGESARWLAEATSAALVELDELARGRAAQGRAWSLFAGPHR
jgi:hypothetical protein